MYSDTRRIFMFSLDALLGVILGGPFFITSVSHARVEIFHP